MRRAAPVLVCVLHCVDSLDVPAAQSYANVEGSAATASSTALLAQFAKRFRGDFDNLAQVVSDRARGLAPREGGGHEHIHCNLQPITLKLPAELGCSREHVLASYYFDGQPERAFRVRIYELRAVADPDCDCADPQRAFCIQMGIYRLREERTLQLDSMGQSSCDVVWSTLDVAPSLRIPDCDVFWRWRSGHFEGRMRTESIIVHSPVLRKPIVVRDDVSLSESALCCNDRGNDLDGKYVYGNIHGVPYKMDRVPWSRCEPLPSTEDFRRLRRRCPRHTPDLVVAARAVSHAAATSCAAAAHVVGKATAAHATI